MPPQRPVRMPQKFQTHTVEDEQLDQHVVSPHFTANDRYAWVKRNTEATPEQFWREVQEHCHRRGILFFTTPMSRGALRKIAPLDPLLKVSSADVQDDILLNAMLETHKPIIISTGMVSLEELDAVVAGIGKRDARNWVSSTVFHSTPVPRNTSNLSSLTRFTKTFPDAVIGFSDHSLRIRSGACRSETRRSDHREALLPHGDLWGSDHNVSMTPAEMQSMVTAIRDRSFEKVDASPFLGDPDRELEGATNAYRPYFGKNACRRA